jgi:hypothetical protein
MPSLLLAVKHAELDRHNAQMMARIEHETADASVPVKNARGATAGGDERRLRGLPGVARGVAGAMAGTQPHQALRDRD